MAISEQNLAALLAAAFGDAKVEIQDMAGDGDHYKVTIISDQFDGLPRVRRHQLVYQALGKTMERQLHALSIQTLTRHEGVQQ